MHKRFRLLLVVLAVLVFSYFARPLYDFSWVVAGRLIDTASGRIGAPLLKQDRQGVLDRADRQGDEIDTYLRNQREAHSQQKVLAALDFSGPENYARSAAEMRARFRQSLRYPPPGFDDANAAPAKETAAGDDGIAIYRLMEIPVLPGVHAVGYYLRPRTAAPDQKLPLIIAAAGRGGKPEPTPDGKLPILLPQSRDLAWDAVRRGYAVWLPTFAHFGQDDENFRDRLTVRAWEAGTSLPAIEIAKVIKALDVLTKRPDIDPGRVAMVGLSYGGFYTLYTTALEPRIRVAVVAAYFNDRASVLDMSEPHGFLDWRYPDSLTLWRDPAVVAMVAPRPLLIEAGNQDQLFPIEGARRAAPQAALVYQKLGVGERFKFNEFVARHDFNGKDAVDFITRHLGPVTPGAR